MKPETADELIKLCHQHPHAMKAIEVVEKGSRELVSWLGTPDEEYCICSINESEEEEYIRESWKFWLIGALSTWLLENHCILPHKLDSLSWCWYFGGVVIFNMKEWSHLEALLAAVEYAKEEFEEIKAK